MAEDRITVTYGRTSEDHTTLQGEISFDLPKGMEWMEEYRKAYIVLRYGIDALFDGGTALPPKDKVATALPGERITKATAPQQNGEYAVYDESARMSDIDPSMPVRFTNCRVFNVEVLRGKKGPWAKIRIGNREQIPGQYINAKSFEPEVVSKLKALEEGDMVTVWGRFDPWKGNEDRDEPKYDLMVDGVDRQ